MFKRTDTVPFKNRIYLSSPTMHGDELEYMTRAFRTNWMSTVGENIDEVERLVARAVGCRYGVALSCGTAAVHMSVKLAGVKPGDTVFCTDMTFCATANPVVYEGGRLVFIDTERETWNMDPAALRRAFELYPDTKTVICVNLYGTPGKLDEIKAICAEHGAVLIEDAAESFGSVYRGRQTGSLGDYGIISFNGNKIVTGSTGGILLTDDAEAADRARKLATQSRERAPWYQHTEVGYNYRMSNVTAGAVRGQLPYLSEHISRKRELYERYKEGFSRIPVTMNPYDADNSEPNFWLSCILIDSDAMCAEQRSNDTAVFTGQAGRSCPCEILQALSSLNAEGCPVWKPMHLQPVFAHAPFVTAAGGSEDVGGDIFRRALCLPSDIKLTPAQQNIIIDTVCACFE